ncbi:MAG: sel1 repeat family protein [Aromatoleum sp.]|jgi:TPR repeat protein|uniref:tetratricopeptide repeat protein n=1 Tax=Aromatoleum sp. TaxID=2307007 RepID=UPI0028940794|nr:sel1 repeat family protein [Aromatoleum sp.]MDT3670058.1 sel1 repeat family protein [Aromatoleum sp.]
MYFPVTEKPLPAFKHVLLALALLGAPFGVHADAAAAYEEGFAAYRKGDVTGSMAPLKRAADGGIAEAQALYGTLLDSAELDEEAHVYLLKAAEQGNADGQFGLAKMYLTGEAKALDEREIARLIHAAAAQEHAAATISLALAYTRRDARFGADTITPETGPLLLKAAELGDTSAIETVSTAYRTGEYGLPVDAAKAEQWSARLAEIRGVKPGSPKK